MGRPMRKLACTFSGIDFPSHSAAARHFGVCPATIRFWIDQGITDPPNRARPHKRQCTFAGIRFPSIEAAADHFEVSGATIQRWLDKGIRDPRTDRGTSLKPCRFYGIDFQSRKAAADHFGVDASTVSKWIRDGETDPLGVHCRKVADTRHLKIYGWFHKPAGRVLYIGRTIRSLDRREKQYRVEFHERPIIKSIRDYPGEWEMVPIKEYRNILASDPDYRRLAKAKEDWWICRKKTKVSQGGYNRYKASFGTLPNTAMTEKDIAEAIDLYESGKASLEMLGERYGVVGYTVRKALAARGVRIRSFQEAIREFGPQGWAGAGVGEREATRAKARKMRRAGKINRVIAAELGIKEGLVSRYCKGIPAAPSAVKLPQSKIDDARRLAKRGLRAPAIAAEVGISIPSVWTHAGDELRAAVP